MNQENIKKDIVSKFLEKKILVSPDFLREIDENFNFVDLYNLISDKIYMKNFIVLTSEIKRLLNELPDNIDWFVFDNLRADYEKEKNIEFYNNYIQDLKKPPVEGKKSNTSGSENSVEVLFSYNEESKKREIQDFVFYFNARYKSIEKILRHRQELQNILSINRILGKKEKENVSLIGIVKDKQTTSNGNIILEMEDITGSIKILISKNKSELFDLSKDIVLDEIIGVVGVSGDNIVFANNIIWPEIPLTKELKKSPDECYAVVISDIHVGSDMFLVEKFNHFLKWINGKIGNEKQKDIASKVKYIIIVGDLVDGVGIYPDQDKELVIKDIYQQYEECANLLKQIPSNIRLIISPGNHDAMRIAEPQPVLYHDFTKSIWGLPNAIMVSNPAIINIHSSNSFSGFNLLLYHGYSFDYYVANVESIRNGGGYDRADLIMKFLLQRRHLAPTHTSTLYIPDMKKDPLVIDQVPDFFIAGHIHKSSAANYRNVTMICGSCWQAKTPFQEKVGHNPEPARVPIINLQTREVKLLRF